MEVTAVKARLTSPVTAPDLPVLSHVGPHHLVLPDPVEAGLTHVLGCLASLGFRGRGSVVSRLSSDTPSTKPPGLLTTRSSRSRRT